MAPNVPQAKATSRLGSIQALTSMRSLVLILIALFCGCSGTSREPEQHTPTALQVIKADYMLPAFGGRLIGTDRGEWIGELLFQDDAGRVETILHENVH